MKHTLYEHIRLSIFLYIIVHYYYITIGRKKYKAEIQKELPNELPTELSICRSASSLSAAAS